MLGDLRLGLLGGRHADLGMGARAQALSDLDAELDAPVGLGELKLLGVGVGDDELHAFQAGVDHVVDRVPSGAADAEDHNTRLELRRLRRGKMNGH